MACSHTSGLDSEFRTWRPTSYPGALVGPSAYRALASDSLKTRREPQGKPLLPLASDALMASLGARLASQVACSSNLFMLSETHFPVFLRLGLK